MTPWIALLLAVGAAWIIGKMEGTDEAKDRQDRIDAGDKRDLDHLSLTHERIGLWLVWVAVCTIVDWLGHRSWWVGLDTVCMAIAIPALFSTAHRFAFNKGSKLKDGSSFHRFYLSCGNAYDRLLIGRYYILRPGHDHRALYFGTKLTMPDYIYIAAVHRAGKLATIIETSIAAACVAVFIITNL